MHSSKGITLLEIILVVALLGIIAGFAATGSRSILQGQEGRAALTSVQQLFWQGATAAASRGETLELVRSGDVFKVQPQGGGAAIRSAELPRGVRSSLPQGAVATFTSPGRVNMANNTFSVDIDGKAYLMTVSLIGEVKREAQ